MNELKKKIVSIIEREDFITIDRFMEISLLDESHGYYRKKQPLGKEGDFITAPEISQLFGEMIGLFLVNWLTQNNISEFEIIELGSGKGTLMNDILLVLKKFPSFYKNTKIKIIDVNEILVGSQRELLESHDLQKEWFSSINEIKTKRPVIVLANEFFDALPLKQFIFEDGRWKQRVIKFDKDFYFSSIATNKKFDGPPNPKQGDIREISPASISIAKEISKLINSNKGLSLIFDYGYFKSAYGDSFQSLYKNKFNNVFENIGQADLTYHVDFELLEKTFKLSGLNCFLQTQRDFFISLGIQKRAEILAKDKDEDTRKNIETSLSRLISEDEMGVLFKCLIAEKV